MAWTPPKNNTSKKKEYNYGNFLGSDISDAIQDMNRGYDKTPDKFARPEFGYLAKYKPSEQVQQYGSDMAGAYSSLKKLNNGEYDYARDPMYQQYRKQYLREGQRAMQDTLAQNALMTGGRPSSYAVGAAQQANNLYAGKAADIVPQLYEQQYNRTMQQLEAAQNMYNNERNFEYGASQDYLNNEMKQRQIEYDIYDRDRAFNYNKQQDNIRTMQTQQAQDWQQFLQRAQMALSVGDYNMLRDMGFDTTRSNFGNDLSIAQIIAQVTGDTSYLRSLMNRK